MLTQVLFRLPDGAGQYLPFVIAAGPEARALLELTVADAAAANTAAIAKAAPILPPTDRKAELDALEEVDAAEAALDKARAEQTKAVNTGDFQTVAKADAAVTSAQFRLAQATLIIEQFRASIAGKETAGRDAQRRAARAARKQLDKDLATRFDRILAAFNKANAAALRELIQVAQQRLQLAQQLQHDAFIVESIDPPIPASVAAPIQPVPTSPTADELGRCPKCNGELGVSTGFKTRTVQCERCQHILADHPLATKAA